MHAPKPCLSLLTAHAASRPGQFPGLHVTHHRQRSILRQGAGNRMGCVQRTQLETRALNIGTQRMFGNRQHFGDLRRDCIPSPKTSAHRSRAETRREWLWGAVLSRVPAPFGSRMRNQDQIALVFGSEPCPSVVIRCMRNGKKGELAVRSADRIEIPDFRHHGQSRLSEMPVRRGGPIQPLPIHGMKSLETARAQQGRCADIPDRYSAAPTSDHRCRSRIVRHQRLPNDKRHVIDCKTCREVLEYRS